MLKASKLLKLLSKGGGAVSVCWRSFTAAHSLLPVSVVVSSLEILEVLGAEAASSTTSRDLRETLERL
jgi:hypothetical protein